MPYNYARGRSLENRRESDKVRRLMLGLRTAQGIDGKRIAESDWFIADSIIADLV